MLRGVDPPARGTPRPRFCNRSRIQPQRTEPYCPFYGGYPTIGTPEATANDAFGTQEARVIGTHPDGSTIDITQTVSTDATGKPVSASGTGTITTSDGITMDITMTMNFSNGMPSGGTMDIMVGAPDNLHLDMTLYATGSAEGTVYSTATYPETLLGTVVVYASTDASGHNGYYQDAATGTKEYF